MGTEGSLPWNKTVGVWNWSVHLMSKLAVSGFVYPLPHIFSWRILGKIFCFKYTIVIIIIIIIIICTSLTLRYFGREPARYLSYLLQWKRIQVFVIIETTSLWQYLATCFNQEGHHQTKVVQKLKRNIMVLILKHFKRYLVIILILKETCFFQDFVMISKLGTNSVT